MSVPAELAESLDRYVPTTMGVMRHRVLACDYDGTLATEGVCSDQTVEALQRVAAAGVRLVLVTGRTREELEEVFDLELLEAAKVRVRLRVAPHTWEAFRLMTVEGLPVAEVAARVHLQVAMVYVAKSKVQKMLQVEIRKLEMGV